MKFGSLAPGLAVVCLMTAAGGALWADDWPRFRGPNGSGVAEIADLPVELSPAVARWSTPVPAGKSSPIVVGDSVFLTFEQGGQLVTLAVSASSGSELWRRAVPALRRDSLDRQGGRAVPSPVSDGESVFAFFPEFGAVSYDLEGSELWRRSLPRFVSYYGLAASPVLAGDTVVILIDQQRGGNSLWGLSKSDGSVRWRQPRATTSESWTTPVLWRGRDRDELIVFGSLSIDAYSPEDGAWLWGRGGVGVTPVSSPIVDGDRFYAVAPDQSATAMPPWSSLSAGDGDDDGRLVAAELPAAWAAAFGWLDVDGSGFVEQGEYVHLAAEMSTPDYGLVAVDLADADHPILWRQTKSLPYLASPLIYRGVLFMVADGGILTSYDPGTGEILKRGRVGAQGNFGPSPVAVDGRLYLISSTGEVATVSAEGEWQLMANSDLDELVWATPALAAGRLFVRTETRLLAFGGS